MAASGDALYAIRVERLPDEAASRAAVLSNLEAGNEPAQLPHVSFRELLAWKQSLRRGVAHVNVAEAVRIVRVRAQL